LRIKTKVKSLASAIVAALLLAGVAQAGGPNLIADPTFSVYGTQALSDPGVGSYFQPNILADWTTPDTTTTFLYLSGQGNSNISQSGGSCATPGTGNSCFALWNSSNNASPSASIVNPPGGGNFIVADDSTTYHESFSTTVTNLVVGGTYKLTFYQAGGQQYGFGSSGNSITAYWQVTLGSSPSQNSATLTVPYQTFSGWSQVTMTFTATATSETLSFLAEGTPAGVPPFALLGDVSLLSTSAEPVSLGIMSLGLLGLGVAARKRTKKRA